MEKVIIRKSRPILKRELYNWEFRHISGEKSFKNLSFLAVILISSCIPNVCVGSIERQRGFDIPGDDETEMDLLVPLENLINSDPRIFRTKGLDGLPAVGIKHGVEIVVPYRIYLPRKFYRNFAILASVRPVDHQGGYLFGILNAFDTIVNLGLLLQPAGPTQTNISLVYTDSAPLSNLDAFSTNGSTAPQSHAIASFVVPAFTNQWTQIAVEVNENHVALYFRCMRFATRKVTRNPIQLEMDDASKLYIANAGPIIGNGFEHYSTEWYMYNVGFMLETNESAG